VIEKLVERGVPREQIAAIGDADSDAKKQSLFEKVRNGFVRVLIGSTQKMGTGTNVQKRLVALHHLDAPWKPAEAEQREGRILRQGNENEEVAIYSYVIEGSFDAYMWQAMETKTRFISQVMTGDSAVRKAEDIGGQELSYAEVKAIATGNPAVLTLSEADAELQRLAVLRKNHADEQFLARRNLRELPEAIQRLERRIHDLETDQSTIAAHADAPTVIGGRKCPRDDVPTILGKRLDALPEKVSQPTRIPLGTYRELGFDILLHSSFAPEVYLEGATIRQATLSREHRGPRAVLNALERLAGSYGEQCEKAKQDLALAEGQLRDYEQRIGKPFIHEAYLTELTELRDRLKESLSNAPAPEGEERPSAAELAERIKALKAAHTIEAAPRARWSGVFPLPRNRSPPARDAGSRPIPHPNERVIRLRPRPHPRGQLSSNSRPIQKSRRAAKPPIRRAGLMLPPRGRSAVSVSSSPTKSAAGPANRPCFSAAGREDRRGWRRAESSPGHPPASAALRNRAATS
jgi:hypothetical protein